MTRARQGTGDTPPRRPPATTPEGAENHMISLAIQLAERQLIEGTASSQVVTHYLKLGSSREMKEQRRIELEIEHLRVKNESVASAGRIEEMYSKALSAMREYQGQDVSHDEH